MPPKLLTTAELLPMVRTFLLDTSHPQHAYIRTNEFTAIDVVLSLDIAQGQAAHVGRCLRQLAEEGLLTRRPYSGTFYYMLAA